MELKRQGQLWKYIFSFLLTIYCINTLVLLGVVFISSVKPFEDVLTNIWGFPRSLRLENFHEVLFEENFITYTMNSIIITSSALIGQLYLASITAYGIARFRYRFNNIIYMYVLIGLMFPVQIGILPLFLLIRGLHLNNTLFSVILIYGASISFPTFVLVGFLKSLPLSIIESAKIDGAGEWRIFHVITVPLMRPVFAALVPLIIIQFWNDFFIPLVFLTVDEIKTIPLGLMKFYAVRGINFSKLNLVFTASAISIIPVVVVYLIASKQIIGGITEGALKN